MPASLPVHLATARRGSVPEAIIRGHLVVVGAAGDVVAAVGDASTITTLRSCVKPLQALPFVRRAMDGLGAGPADLAVACGSHNGEPIHVRTVSALLDRVGLDAGALTCGPQLPYDQAAADQAILSGAGPQRLTNNCSGKHAAMLATCTVAGWPTEGYADVEHPLQREIRSIIGGYGGLDLSAQSHGIDGCGLPTHGVPLRFLARAFAAAAADSDFRRCQDAMAAHPQLVAGRKRFDTALLAAAGQRITVKGGGAAVWAAVRRPAGPALAIKLEAGDASAMSAVALEALRALGWLGDADAAGPELSGFGRPALRNWEGTLVGEIEVALGWQNGLAV